MEGERGRRILTFVKKEHRRCEFFDAIDPRRYSNEASPFLPMKERIGGGEGLNGRCKIGFIGDRD